jgi:hypothetical protein
MANVGDTFKTGNAIVAELPVGTALVVSDEGELEILDIPEDDVEDEVVEVVPGVQFTSKRGNVATVVDLTTTGGLNQAAGEGDVFYVEDGVNRVRRTTVDFVQSNAI